MGGISSVVERLGEGPAFNLGTYPVMKEYKITRRREQIFGILAESRGRHLSAYDIYGELKKKDHFAGMATVYRTLELFAKVGIIRTVDMRDGYKRYELCLTREGNFNGSRHSHLVCIKCGDVIEMEFDVLNGISSQLDRVQFKVEDVRLMITGYCKKCRYDTS